MTYNVTIHDETQFHWKLKIDTFTSNFAELAVAEAEGKKTGKFFTIEFITQIRDYTPVK